MAEFSGFGQLTRPDIGLIADGVQNLAEIFKSDQDDALRNIRLNPEILDIIYGLSNTISREDLRAVSGLSSLLLPTLHLQNETFQRINNSLDDYVNSREKIGLDQNNPSLRGDLVKVDNVIVYNGSIQCEGVTYKTKVLGSGLYSGGETRSTAVSTSRASLFNSEQDDNGYFKSATYTGSVRVRRRSHVNRITLNPNTFIPRAPVTESPSHKINCWVDNGNTGSAAKLGLLTTKNSPLKIPCRMSSGSITFGYTGSGKYFFGYQVQPLESRVAGEVPGFLPLDPKPQLTDAGSYTVNIDVTTTGYQNSYDLYLYLYLNPEQIRSLTFNGISVSEFLDGKDIGLVGFNNLESLTLRGTSIKILPVWLKTLDTKLRVLDISGSGDSWYNGLLKWFDYRDPSATPSSSFPLYTMVSYLTVPKKGGIVNEDGDDWSDAKFEKYIKNQARVAGTDYRPFTAMKTLSLGDRVYGKNARLDDVFPNLTSLYWRGTRSRAPLSGTPPKIAKPGIEFTSYNIKAGGSSGNITDIGTSATSTDADHISKYRFGSFDIGGESYRYSSISGYIGDPSEDWSEWFQNTSSIDINRSNVSINLQPSSGWQNLQSCSLYYSGGVVFSAGDLECPLLRSIDLYGSPSSGPVPSLGSESNTNALEYFRLGANNLISTISEGGFSYILPQGFAPERASANHKLQTFAITDYAINGRFRENDFKYLYNLTFIDFLRGYSLHGKFPIVPTKEKPETEEKEITIRISDGCDFYDLSALNINPSNRYVARDLVSIEAYSQNTPGGGCKLPDLRGLGGADATKIRTIWLSNSLKTTYPSSWNGNERSQGQYIFEGDGTSVVSSCTPATTNNGTSDNPDNVYYIDGPSDLTRLVLVNDSVHTSVNGSELARVISVSSTRIYIDSDIFASLGGSSRTLYFKRHTQPIDNWFESGFADLNTLRMPNCRLSGKINIRSGFSKLVTGSDGRACLDLSSNCLTGYVEGFRRIFSGSNRKIVINLSSNNFSVSEVRNMLDELLEIEAERRFTNVRVDLNATKLNSSRTYENYTQEELFPTTIEAASSQTISLNRSVRINVYQNVTTVDEDGVETTTKTVVGTKVISVPGKYISGVSGVTIGYYKTQTNGRQRIIENNLGSRLKATNRWTINLGFTYQAPNTSPSVTSTSYSNPITQAESYAEAGILASDVVSDPA